MERPNQTPTCLVDRLSVGEVQGDLTLNRHFIGLILKKVVNFKAAIIKAVTFWVLKEQYQEQ
jgi:hypothetical protein